MNNAQKGLVAAAMTLSVACLASSAQASAPQHSTNDADQITPARAKALHECSLRADKTYPAWATGSENVLSFSECMAEHGQPE